MAAHAKTGGTQELPGWLASQDTDIQFQRHFTMATQTDRVTSELRDLILRGEAKAGERVTELGYASRLGASRTPLRLAFAELEKEGLLEHLPSGGYRVCQFSIKHIVNAVEVRGALEGMAARLVAEAGIKPDTLSALKGVVDAGRRLVGNDADADSQAIDAEAWRHLNSRFHDILVKACDNEALLNALGHNNRLPFVGPGALTLPLAPTKLKTSFVARAQADHEDILQALIDREAVRAEALMREHAHRSGQNKRKLIEATHQAQHPLEDPTELGPVSLLADPNSY